MNLQSRYFSPIHRRSFLAASLAGTASFLVHAAEPTKTYRAAIIGRSGGGDYGHGFDTIFSGLDRISVEALADSHENGRKAAGARAGAKRLYSDYREMLAREKPDIVSIAPRQPDCHRAMALACLEAGAHLIVEKPFTEHLNEADEIVALAQRRGVKVAVGHKNRYTADFARIQRLLREGFLGTVLEMRVQGKQDSRVGGEDLIVLGTHDFDTMRFFFGDPLWCFAAVTVQSRAITRADVHPGREPMLVAGDTVRAQFQFANSVLASWQSVKAEEQWHTAPRGTERWGFTIFGTRRILSCYSLAGPLFLDTPFLGHTTQTSDWRPLPEPKDWPPKVHETNLAANLLHAIESDRQPLCSGGDGRWTIEMVSAVYESQRLNRRVEFPLAERTNPLLRL